MTRKVRCIVTGKETIYSGDFLQKKVEEYGSEELLDKLYVCREVRSFLKKGYNIPDIQKLLNVEENVILPSDEIIEEIVNKYGKKSILKDTPSFNEALTGFTYNKSDEAVEKFIKEYIIGT